MERRRVLLVGLLVGLFSLTTILAGPTAPSGNMTVGDFAVLVASRMVVERGQEMTPAVANEVLKKRGLKINADLNGPLTEKDAAELFGQLGIALQTDHPTDLLDSQRAANIVGIFGDSLASKAGPMPSSFASQAGGVSLETGGTPPPSNIIVCQSRKDSIACFFCCINELHVTWYRCIIPCLPKNLVSGSEPCP
jgi:hypothetical protein